MEDEKGFTLLELLACLLIITVLLLSGVPSYSKLLQSSRVKAMANAFSTEIRKNRALARSRNASISICHSADGRSCSGNWNQGLLSFNDRNANGHLDGEDSPIYWFAPDITGVNVRWRAFANRQSLTFPGIGRFMYNGSFTFCPEDGDARLAQQLSINITGRDRLMTDDDRDGFVEDRYGHVLDCP